MSPITYNAKYDPEVGNTFTDKYSLNSADYVAKYTEWDELPESD